MTRIQEIYTEVVIYEINLEDPAAWQAARKVMIETLGRYPGFHSIETLQSLEKPNLLMDYVKWTDPSLARQAAEQAQKDPLIANAFSFIQKVEFFHHFKEYKG